MISTRGTIAVALVMIQVISNLTLLTGYRVCHAILAPDASVNIFGTQHAICEVEVVGGQGWATLFIASALE